MIIGTATIKLYVPLVHSLKEKRMIVKSVIAKIQNKFNVSIAEVSEQDRLQTIILGIACITNTVRQSDSIIFFFYIRFKVCEVVKPDPRNLCLLPKLKWVS